MSIKREMVVSMVSSPLDSASPVLPALLQHTPLHPVHAITPTMPVFSSPEDLGESNEVRIKREHVVTTANPLVNNNSSSSSSDSSSNSSSSSGGVGYSGDLCAEMGESRLDCVTQDCTVLDRCVNASDTAKVNASNNTTTTTTNTTTTTTTDNNNDNKVVPASRDNNANGVPTILATSGDQPSFPEQLARSLDHMSSLQKAAVIASLNSVLRQSTYWDEQHMKRIIESEDVSTQLVVQPPLPSN